MCAHKRHLLSTSNCVFFKKCYKEDKEELKQELVLREQQRQRSLAEKSALEKNNLKKLESNKEK